MEGNGERERGRRWAGRVGGGKAAFAITGDLLRHHTQHIIPLCPEPINQITSTPSAPARIFFATPPDTTHIYDAFTSAYALPGGKDVGESTIQGGRLPSPTAHAIQNPLH